MGFDPDRAQLITSLIVGAAAAAAAALVWDRALAGTALGALAFAALYLQTFVAETQNAAAAVGATGRFDPVGWGLTLLTLIVVSAVAAWAGATLACALRPAMIATGLSIREIAVERRASRRSARRPVAALLVLALLAVTVPAFGNMVNLSPDALMLAGGNYVPLVPGNSLPALSFAPVPSATPTPTPEPVNSAGSSVPTQSPTPHANPGTKPWLAWKPSGSGHVTLKYMAAPWTGGTSTLVDLNIYTPPGYGADPTRRYPVLYEAPTGLGLWGSGTGVIAALDQLIDSGDVPASLVVFIDSGGAPYPDTECANSYDGKMWMETFVHSTVVDYVDANYLTIRDPNARGIMGMSAGGFCSAMLVARNPETFSTAISFSGYFYAGTGSSTARRPYGNQANIDAASPALLVPKLTADQRARLYFIVDASPTQQFYGPQAQNFEAILSHSKVGFYGMKSIWVHSWTQVRNDFPEAVKAWAARMVVDGVW
jgi:enterochelin esterase-like enzyme